MALKTNVVFLGCNYGNKKVKGHFDQIKHKWEAAHPIRVCLIDREQGKGSRDLWKEITTAIDSASLAIFDVSAFRPNVVLELGYALAVKDPENILISFDERKQREGKKPDWLLSDIGHLNQIRYKVLESLDAKLAENLIKVPAVKLFSELEADAATESATASDKYVAVALAVLHRLRDAKTLSDQQVQQLGKGTGVRVATLKRLLKRHKLARRSQGPNGRWMLVEEG